jgi:predicted amidohydrolase
VSICSTVGVVANAVRTLSVEKIGFFRFVTELDHPIEELAKAMEVERKHHPNSTITNSLIVLPEAFNMGGPYRPPALDGTDNRVFATSWILEELRKLAVCKSVAFVGGILDIESKRNSAYWVDANGPELMCHKMGSDGKKLYDTCTERPDRSNPVACANASVGALICLDATTNDAKAHQRRTSLLARLKETEGYIVLCVPSQFTVNMPDALAFFPKVPDYWYIVADGGYNQTCLVAHVDLSHSANPLEARKVQATAPTANVVKLWPLR